MIEFEVFLVRPCACVCVVDVVVVGCCERRWRKKSPEPNRGEEGREEDVVVDVGKERACGCSRV